MPDATNMRKGKQRSESSTDRVLSLLELFTEEQPIWTTDALIERQAVARATIYRYLKVLVEAGFLAPLGGGSYALGPRVIQMDRQIRLADPLLQIAKPLMAAQRDKVEGTQLLCRYYGFSVISIHDDHIDPRIKTSFDRGRPFSLLYGAPSRIILANLSAQKLQRLFLHHSTEISKAGLGENWPEFRDNMRAVRERGYAVASDIDKSLVGVAAPIFVAPDVVTGSLCLVRLKKETTQDDIAMLGDLAMATAAKITARLQQPQALGKRTDKKGEGRGSRPSKTGAIG